MHNIDKLVIFKLSSFVISSYLSLSGPAGDHDNLLGELLLLHPDGLLDGDLIEGVHGVLDALGHHPGLVWLDSDLDGIVDDSLAADQNSQGHDVFVWRKGWQQSSENVNPVRIKKNVSADRKAKFFITV